MPEMNYKKIEYMKNETFNNSLRDKCIKKTSEHCCECMVDFKTYLIPAPKKNSKIREFSRVVAKIEKICEGKIILGGVLHKTICYTSLAKNNCNHETKCIKRKKIPFKCFINIDCKYSKDKFEIVGCKALCNSSKVINKKNCCSNTAILVEKDIIKITVKRKPCSKNCNYYFGNSVVDSEICFVPAVNPKKSSVSFNVNPKSFKVILICCDLIVVSGVITQIITFKDETPPAKKDILVEVKVPANIEDLNKLDKNKWEVTQAKMCDSCYYFTCPNEDGILYNKLIEKGILSIEVSYKCKCADS